MIPISPDSVGDAVCSVPGRTDLVEDLLLGDLHRVEVLLLDPVLGDYGCAM